MPISRDAAVRGGGSPVASLPAAERLAAGFPPLLVAAQRVAATVSQGVHGRRRVGPGESFWQFRRYQPGDAAARIDWRQTAKADRLYVRQTEWEAAQSLWLWRDASASMAYRSDARLATKAHVCDLLLLALASLLVRGGERVALLGTGAAPATGRAALTRLASVLGHAVGATIDVQARAAGAASAAERVTAPSPPPPEARCVDLPPDEPLPRFARLVVFGDFLTPLERVRQTVQAFARRGVRGHLVQVLDPAEESLPFSGRVLFTGSEAEGEALFGRAEAVRADYLRALAAHREGLHAIARAGGWSLLHHRTDQPAQVALLELFAGLAETRPRQPGAR
jgi:uncharacterized protein (DUF58 family)